MTHRPALLALVLLASGCSRADAPAAQDRPDHTRCQGAISLAEAIAVAEQTARGEAVLAIPDDDVACAREVQVRVGDKLMEVKVAANGAILEYELSDEHEDDEHEDD